MSNRVRRKSIRLGHRIVDARNLKMICWQMIEHRINMTMTVVTWCLLILQLFYFKISFRCRKQENDYHDTRRSF